jgi:hypothetical protein
MQAVTVAIGPAGVTYFAQQLVANRLVSTLAGLRPPDKSFSLPDFIAYGVGYTDSVSNLKVNLSSGSLSGFHPLYQSVAQQTGGKFLLSFGAPSFTVNYNWFESYHDYACFPSCYGSNCSSSDPQNSFGYGPVIGNLATTVTLGFVFDSGSDTYQMNVVGSTGVATNVTPNIPGKSVLQEEDTGCFTSHVSDATASAMSTIDFATPISALFPPLWRSIPASGQLTPDIRYDFAVGDSGLTFPSDNGIAIGVTGSVTYKGQPYPGTPPTGLPVPPVPTDTNHLQVYVSDYELNALHWAYFQAGLLAVTVEAAQLQDPDVLKCKTYVPMIPAFKPYSAFAMQAKVVPKAAPVAAFELVYQLTDAVMNQLQQQLPSNVYQQLSGLQGNAYAARADLESDLAAAGVAQTYYGTIETAAKSMGMVVTQNLEFTLTIENGVTPQPNLVFDLQRTDILQNLGLGQTAGGAQTLQYSFRRVSYAATFVSTTVPNFDKQDFGGLIWPVAGEPRYEDALAAMGKTGVPIPIMAGFQFVFQKAQLSIQQGYVSVLSQVAFKGTSLI